MNGLDLLAKLRTRKSRAARRGDDVGRYAARRCCERCAIRRSNTCTSRWSPATLLDTVREALDAPEPLPIEVISARPEWVEIVVPCTREAADRIQAVMAQLETTLPQDVRDSIAQAFRELLMNAIEWGGRLDPNHKVRIACLRSRRMLMYRIADPGPGFNIETCRTRRSDSHPAIRSRTCT